MLHPWGRLLPLHQQALSHQPGQSHPAALAGSRGTAVEPEHSIGRPAAPVFRRNYNMPYLKTPFHKTQAVFTWLLS